MEAVYRSSYLDENAKIIKMPKTIRFDAEINGTNEGYHRILNYN